jgi:hypothetical protein
MAPEKSTELLARERLETLGISLRSEWDVLSFLYSHDTSLTSAAQIAHLLGHGKAPVHAALDRLESKRLIERSRGSEGVRLYRISVPRDPLQYSCFMELMKLDEKREGRLLLLKHLPRGGLRPLTQARGLRLA